MSLTFNQYRIFKFASLLTAKNKIAGKKILWKEVVHVPLTRGRRINRGYKYVKYYIAKVYRRGLPGSKD